jgi:hypothetical protein
VAGNLRKDVEVAILKACAAAHGVSDRAVRNWRNGGDARWLEFKGAWAKRNIGEGNVAQVVSFVSDEAGIPPVPEVDMEEDDGLGDGLNAEIVRSERECRRLAHRASWLERKGLWDAAAMCHRVLDSKRDQLRKLRLDTPEAGQRDGTLIAREVVVTWAAAVVAEFRALPGRIVSKLPMDTDPEVKLAIEAEIGQTLTRAAEMELV